MMIIRSPSLFSCFHEYLLTAKGTIRKRRRILDFRNFFIVGCDFCLPLSFAFSPQLNYCLSNKKGQTVAKRELSCMHMKHSAQEQQTFPNHSHKQKEEKFKCIFVMRRGVQ